MSAEVNGGGRRAWQPLPHSVKPPTPIREALDNLAATMGLASVDGINRLFLAWPSIVGDDVATQCRPKRLSDGILTVEAVDQQWATELTWMASLIVERCGEALGPGEVLEVRVVR